MSPAGGRRSWGVLVAAAVALVACSVEARPPPRVSAVDPTPTTTTSTADPVRPSTPTPPGTAPGPAPTPTTGEDPAERLAAVVAVVEQVRALDFTDPPVPAYVSSDELARRVRHELDAAYPAREADLDRRLYAALGAIPPDFDLAARLRDAFAGQVAGFYDPETGELVVEASAPGRALTRLEELVLAHELGHALVDDALGLPPLDTDPGDPDGAVARQALVEGDATVMMGVYATEAFSLLELLTLPLETLSLQGDLAAVEALPHVLQRSLTFPYEQGLTFVEALRADGGWGAVDAAYRRPPTATDQILFPQRYLDGEHPRPPVAPGDPGGDWALRRAATFGAADLLFLFEAPGGDPARALDDPRAAVRGWRGGIVEVHTDGARTAVGIALTDGGGLCASVRTWYAATFRRGSPAGASPPAAATTMDCPDGEVRIGIAPDRVTATALVATG